MKPLQTIPPGPTPPPDQPAPKEPREPGVMQFTNNCTNPPHFPPHCGCPAG